MTLHRPRRELRDTGADTVRGIALANLCFLLLTLGDVATVLALPVMGVVGAMAGRGIVASAIVAAVAARQPGGIFLLRPVRWRLVAFRSVVHAFSSLTWYIAWSWSLGLADSYAVGYAAPLLMILLAGPMLAERVGWRRGLATGVGFLGMLVMMRPGGDLWKPAAALLILGVTGMAVSRNLTRVLATTEAPECLAFWLLLAHLPVGALMLGLGFPVPHVNLLVVVCLLALGASNGIAHWLHARACALAPMAALAPFEYVGLIWATVFGYLVFGQVPAMVTMGGAVLVVTAGLATFLTEHRRSRAERAAP